jgi:hypothetical protein
MKVNIHAINQWNLNCKKKEGIRRTTYKILRAVVMGKVLYTVGLGDYVVRYFDMNVYVDKRGEVLAVWRTNLYEPHGVPYNFKNQYDKETTFKQNLRKAVAKHYRTLKRIAKGFGEQTV